VHFEQVEREVFGAERERFVEVSLPGTKGLAGEPGDEVEADVVEARGAEVFERPARVVGGVRAAESLQLAVVEGLRAEARAVDAGLAQRP
jgi:hypothetical protein